MAGRFDVEEERKLLAEAKLGNIESRRKCHIKFKGMLDSITNNTFVNNVPKIALRAEAERLLDVYIDQWDPNAKNKPSTFLMGNISKKILRYAYDYGNPVRITEHYNVHMQKYKTSLDELNTQFQRLPTHDEIATHMNKKYKNLNFNAGDIKRLEAGNRTTTHSSTTIGNSDEGGASLFMSDVAFVQGEDDPMEDYLADVKVRELMAKVNLLMEPKKTIIMHTFGLSGYNKLSLRALALKLGINKYKVQTYLEEAMNELGME